MNNKTLEALRGSIAKWEGIIAGTVEDLGDTNCPLCQMFNNDDSEWPCRGCPVKKITGATYCKGSPYVSFAKVKHHGSKNDEYREAAQAELDFLKSLLPQDEAALTAAEGRE